MLMGTDKRTTYLAVILGFHEVIGVLLGKTPESPDYYPRFLHVHA